MVLDLVFGAFIAVVAFRGWRKGFVVQVVSLVSLVASVYLGDRVRDYAKPYVIPYFATIQADLIDRLLWWMSAIATYLVLVGVAMIIIKMTRRPEIPGISQKGRNDQFAGFMLGATKGVLLAAVMAHAIQSYGMAQVKTVAWADEQVKTSWAFRWNESYQPLPKIWSSRLVRHFVKHIVRMGITKPEDLSPSGEDADAEEESPVRTASSRREPAFSGPASSEPESNASQPAPAAESKGSEPADAEAAKAERPKNGHGKTELEGSN